MWCVWFLSEENGLFLLANLIVNTLAVSNNGTIKIPIAMSGIFSSKNGKSLYESGESAKNLSVNTLIMKLTLNGSLMAFLRYNLSDDKKINIGSQIGRQGSAPLKSEGNI